MAGQSRPPLYHQLNRVESLRGSKNRWGKLNREIVLLPCAVIEWRGKTSIEWEGRMTEATSFTSGSIECFEGINVLRLRYRRRQQHDTEKTVIHWLFILLLTCFICFSILLLITRLYYFCNLSVCILTDNSLPVGIRHSLHSLVHAFTIKGRGEESNWAELILLILTMSVKN